jgi:hypothetical protein
MTYFVGQLSYAVKIGWNERGGEASRETLSEREHASSFVQCSK